MRKIIIRASILFTFAFALSSAGAKESVDTCLNEFPELLSRVDAELKPWTETGITRQMLDNLWRCDNGDPERHPNDVIMRRFGGLKVIVRSGKLQVEKAVHAQAKFAVARGELVEIMLNAISARFDLPDVELMMSTWDHLQQAFMHDELEKVVQTTSSAWPQGFGAYSPLRAPLMVAYRLQMDTGTVAVPDWTFTRFPQFPANLPEIDEAAKGITAAARQKPWFNRSSLLFFVGQNHGGAQRYQAYELAVKTKGWGLIGGIGGKGYGYQQEHISHHTLEDHCKYKYLLHLAGNGGSARLKYLFFCNSTVVAPVRAGGLGGAGPNNEFEEFFFHRLKDGDNCFRPKTVFELPELIHSLQPPLTSNSSSGSGSSSGSNNRESPVLQENVWSNLNSSSAPSLPGDDSTQSVKAAESTAGDALAQAVASRGAAWASKELTQRAAHCYWAYVIDRVAALERQGGALPPRPNNSDGPQGTLKPDLWVKDAESQGTQPKEEGEGADKSGTEKRRKEEGEGSTTDGLAREPGLPPGKRGYDCCRCHDSVDFLKQRGVRMSS